MGVRTYLRVRDERMECVVLSQTGRTFRRAVYGDEQLQPEQRYQDENRFESLSVKRS